MAFSLRDATPADLAAIMAIEHEVFPVDAWPQEVMALELGAPYGRYLVAIDDAGEIRGYAGLRVVGEQGDVQTIAVAPESRRRGIARALLLELLAEARERRAADVFLEVRADNPGAIALYAGLGFARIAIRPRYYPAEASTGSPVDAVVMRLDRRGLRAVPRLRTGADA